MITMSVPVKSQTPDDLAKGEQKGVASCTVKGESLTCVVVKHNGITYAIAGFVKNGDFYERYVGREVNKTWVIVWSFEGGI